jgi:glucuronoarabinoxylan endo-1,4-beta-xylanase
VTGGAGGDTGGAAATGGGGTGGEGTGGDATGGTTSGDVTVQLAQTRQLIRGFGINNNWAGAMSSQVADRLFGTGNQQLGFNILRVGMGSDGEPYNGSNCYADINAAVSRGAEYIIGTLWSPPANCKTNNSITDGGHLLESCYESWSTTIANFADKISQNTNTTLYAMAPQNEVDFASCGTQEPCNGNYDTTVFTGDEAAAFQKIVGPKIRAKGVIPMSPEASEWIHVWSNESACCSEPSGLPSSDPLNCGFPPDNCPPGAPFEGYEYGYALYADSAAWDAFDILGVHQYDSQISYAWPSDVPKGNKEVWQTEMSGVKWWPEQGETNAQGVLTGCSTHIQNGVAVARWIWHALTVGEANAWLYWWYQALSTDDNEGLLCSDGRVAKRLWTMGQYSKFIRPGHHIVDITGNVPANVMLVASLGQDSSVVVVAANETDSAVDLPITIAGGTAPTGMDVWQTSASDDLASKSAVTVTGGTFTASLPAMSVTTFVSQ